MRLFVILLMICMHLSVLASGQKVTLNKKNAEIGNLLKEIKKQSGYNFLFDAGAIKNAPRIDIVVKDVSLQIALNECFAGLGLRYIIKDKNVIISKAGESVQNRQTIITGKVTNLHGDPISGVTIRFKNSPNRTVSDDKGNFKIPITVGESILVFSNIGYVSKEVKILASGSITVVLHQLVDKLDEVVVVGYGTIRKSDLTGAIGQVNVKDLQKAPVASFDEALAGRIAGVQVTSNDGQPGNGGINIVIRGANSLTQSNSPLYVIDGFPTEDSENSAINPDDIESITILKDASATAIYGARGANGVIVIETKKGKIGEPVINFSSLLGSQKITKTMEMMDAYEFVKYQYERNATNATSLYLKNGKTIEDYKQTKGSDWQNLLFNEAFQQTHNLSIRGGNPNTKYSVSGSILNHEGVVVNSGVKRYQGRVVLDQKLKKNISFGINLNMSHLKGFGQLASAANSASGAGASTYLLYSTWGYRPVTLASLDLDGAELEDQLLDPDIDHSTDYRINPVISAKNELRQARTTSIMANTYLSYNLNKNLTLKLTGGIDSWSRGDDSFYNSNTSRGTPLLPGNIRGQWGSKFNSRRFTWVNENTLTWMKTINKIHKLNIVGGFTMQGSDTQSNGFTSQNVPNEQLGLSGLDEGMVVSARSVTSNFTMASFLGRVNYNYKSRYYFTATFRADGSSKFPVGNKWGYFPSTAVSWRIGSEPYLKNVEFISDAKIRASYGITGNNRVSDFASFAGLNMPIINSYSFNNGSPLNGINLNSLGNINLLWESTGQIDLGFDLELFRNRVSVGFDVYRKNTYDLLLNANIPATTGYSKVFKNIGKVRNQGLELTLNTINVKTDAFSWESNFNISFNNNKIIALAENEDNMLSMVSWETSFNSVPLYIAALNQPAAMFFGYIWDGVYQYADFDKSSSGQYTLRNDVATNGNDRKNIRPGDIKYQDINDDGVVNELDRTIIGRTTPVHVGGLSNNFNYKGLSLNVFFQWSYGNQVYNANRIMFEGNAESKSSLNQFASYKDRWTPNYQTNELFRTGGGGPYGVYSSRVVEDGSYLRLKTVSIAYDFSKSIYNRLYMKGLRVNVSAQNLYTWTNYTGLDPEVSVRNSALTPSFDYSAYPRARTLVLGVKAIF